MISDARGGHVSPGVYTEEKDVLYSVKSLGITSLGLVGETVKGPAFQVIPVSDWSEFVDYFGGTSTEKYKGNGYPKYELPYIAKSYLTESRNLNVVRVLGLSGYDAGKAFGVKFSVAGKTYPLAILRTKGEYGMTNGQDTCGKGKYEQFTPYVSSISIASYKKSTFDAVCAVKGTEVEIPLTASTDTLETIYDDFGSFSITVVLTEAGQNAYGTEQVKYNVSLNPNSPDYIYNIFSMDPLVGSSPLFIESVYDYAFEAAKKGLTGSDTIQISDINGVSGFEDYKEIYRCAETPWFVSEVKSATKEAINLKKLFKFYTISDGNAANYQVKISIQNIRPETGMFDVVVRDFYDVDESPVVLEKFANCTMVEGDSNYIGLKIGTFDGGYISKSKYVVVRIAEEDGIESCVPCGHLGYPMPKYGCDSVLEMAYNRFFDDSVKPRRQYFGLNSNILDVDILNYKGVDAYDNLNGNAKPELLTNGFHLDAILDKEVIQTGSLGTVYVDGVTGFNFTTVSPVQNTEAYSKLPRIYSEGYMSDTIYADKNLRKFTVYPFGGFDGWDIYRDQRTNTDDFKASRYFIPTGETACPFEKIGNTELVMDPTLNLNLPANAINSDYYAYLAGYKQFANPHDVDINVFATPGIDFAHNLLLVEDALDIIEDVDDGRGGDAIHVITAPQDGEYSVASEVVYNLEESELTSSYACTYWPWVKYYDQSVKSYIELPATKDVVRNMAATDNNAYPWFAPAGVERGVVDCVKASYKTTLSDEDTLYDGRVNPIKSFAVDGVKVWGNKTLYNKETPLNRINVRRLMIRVKKLVTDASKALIFEQYDVALEKQFRSLVEPILADVKSNRGIVDYKVITECTPETRDQHILPAKILIKPTPALEYISISFTVYPESVDFQE